MKTKIFETTKNDIEEASRLIQNGEVVAFQQKQFTDWEPMQRMNQQLKGICR